MSSLHRSFFAFVGMVAFGFVVTFFQVTSCSTKKPEVAMFAKCSGCNGTGIGELTGDKTSDGRDLFYPCKMCVGKGYFYFKDLPNVEPVQSKEFEVLCPKCGTQFPVAFPVKTDPQT